MPNQNTPKPDDRSNNVERLQQMIENTKDNIEKAEISTEFAGPEEAQKIKEKNDRRNRSIDAMIKELTEEAEARKNGYK